MTNINQEKKTYPLYTTIIGTLSFFLISFLMGLLGTVIGFDINILPLLVAGVLAPLIMLSVLNIRDKIWLNILISAITLVAAFIIAFLFGYIVAAIAPGGENSILVNAAAILVMNGIYGMVMGTLLYGRDATRFFLAVTSLAGLFLGVIFTLTGDFKIMGIDFSYLYIITTFGVTLGLALGLYKSRKHKTE